MKDLRRRLTQLSRAIWKWVKQRWWPYLAVAVVVLLAVWLLPGALVTADSGTSLTAAQRSVAVATSRQQLLLAIGGLLTGIALFLTWRRDRIGRDAEKREQDENFTGRYAEAINQLGSEVAAIRLGGVYALERLGSDSTRERVVVLDILTAYVREQSVAAKGDGADVLPIDLSAAVASIGRLSQLPCERRPIDLAGAWLPGADLARANLSGAKLRGTDLTNADLSGASLSGADVSDSVLNAASLNFAKLPGVNLARSQLVGAEGYKAVLVRACLDDANLTGAAFLDAELVGATLQYANLSRANFSASSMAHIRLYGAVLDGTFLSGSDLEEASFVGATLKHVLLMGANLTRASFESSDVEGVELSDAQRAAVLDFPVP